MAKVNYGTIVNDARGKVNGTVFSKNKSGAYTRRKVTPANPSSPAQSGVRANFALLSQAWSGALTDLERQAWRNYAATYPRLDVFGAAIQLTGLNMFISLNQVLMNLGLAYNANPPGSNVILPVPFDPASLTATAPIAALGFMETAATPLATNKFYIFGEAPTAPGRQPDSSKMRFLGVLPGIAGPYPVAIDVLPIWTPKFGAWLVGQRISLLIATVDTLTGLTTVGTTLTVIST